MAAVTMAPKQHREHAVDLILERARYSEQPSVLKYLEAAGVEHTVDDAKAIFALIGTATVNVWFPDDRAPMSHPYARALLAEIDKLNGDLQVMRETVSTLVDQRDAARREANVAATNAIRFHHRILQLEAELAKLSGAVVEPHPWQEYNAHGYLCHYPGCQKTPAEHEETK